MIKWAKKLKNMVASYDTDLHRAHARIAQLEQIIKERTEVNVDVAYSRNDKHHVILVGRYKNVDYVETFSFSGDTFERLVSQLREMSKYGTIQRVDAPPGFRIVIDKGMHR